MSWNDRYSKGVWAACMPGFYQCQAVRDASEDGDADMIPATEYLLESTWLPVVTAENLVDGLSSLEARIALLDESQLTRDSDWIIASQEAMTHFMEVRRAADYGRTDGKFRPLPQEFSAVARIVESRRTKGGSGAMW
jgi:hypothetical protein